MPTQFFRVDGADQETGEETHLLLQADTKPHAEKLARGQGLLVSSIRVAKPGDWEAAPAEPPALQEPMVEPEPIIEAEAVIPSDPEPMIEPAPATERPIPPSPAAPSSARPASSSAAVVLACVGGSLMVGGVLALVLALWPDNTLRNELQQIDFRLHELSQTILGSMLVLGGLIVFVLAAVCHLLPRRDPPR